MKKTGINNPIILLLMAVFLYSATAKAFDYTTFSSELAKSPFLESSNNFLSWMVPLSEGIIGISILIRRTKSIGLYIYLFMMASFTFYVYMMKKEAYFLPCACMGIFESLLDWDSHFYVNIALTVLTVLAIFLNNEKDPIRMTGS